MLLPLLMMFAQVNAAPVPDRPPVIVVKLLQSEQDALDAADKDVKAAELKEGQLRAEIGKKYGAKLDSQDCTETNVYPAKIDCGQIDSLTFRDGWLVIDVGAGGFNFLQRPDIEEYH